MFRAVLESWPDLAVAWVGLATAQGRGGDPADAVQSYRRAIALQPDMAPAVAGLATVLQSLGRHGEAEAVFRRALTLAPHDAAMRAGFAQSLRALGRHQEAESQARLALHLDPRAPLGHFALGATLIDQGETDAAIAAFRAGVALPPPDAESRTAAGMIRLLLGDYPEGWGAYQARPGAGPGWPDGTDPRGARIDVRPEQGLGDTLQFARFLPLLAARGAQVGFAAPGPLRRLLRSLPGVAEGAIVLDGLAEADHRCALLDLGHLLGVTPFAASVLPATVAGRWAEAFAPDGRLRVGLAWSGNPAHPNDPARSAGLAAFAPILDVPGCRFVRVQAAGDGAGIEAPELGDFADTAGLMAHLDVVVSVDSAPAHLAGVLGVPVCVLLPAMPDWRWQLARADCPWYPSARLFRQSRAGDWAAPVAAVAAALRARDIPARGGIG